MNEKIHSFADLKAWQEGHKLVILTYKVTQDFPKTEDYALTSQMRRAVISITSNIAEGFGRQGYKEKIQFYYITQGSIIELKNQILVAKDVGYLSDGQVTCLVEQINLTHKLLQGLISGAKKILNS